MRVPRLTKQKKQKISDARARKAGPEMEIKLPRRLALFPMGDKLKTKRKEDQEDQ